MDGQVATYEVARRVLDAVSEALAAAGRPVREEHVAAGVIAWDDCCGTLVVAPERTYRSQSFPDEFVGLEQCFGGFITVQLVVLLVRCVPTVDDLGQSPSADDKDAAYRALLDDGDIVWNTVSGPLGDSWERAGVSQLFNGDQGGCVGVETRVTVGVDTDVWP
jgi:hypothetical protein